MTGSLGRGRQIWPAQHKKAFLQETPIPSGRALPTYKKAEGSVHPLPTPVALLPLGKPHEKAGLIQLPERQAYVGKNSMREGGWEQLSQLGSLP